LQNDQFSSLKRIFVAGLISAVSTTSFSICKGIHNVWTDGPHQVEMFLEEEERGKYLVYGGN
jgi:hypothetical protein